MKDWRMPVSRRSVKEWGAYWGLKPGNDREPVVDDTAACVGPFGSTVAVSGLSRDARYRVWIDFVRFKPVDKCPDTVLKILASGPGMEPRCIAAVRYSDVSDLYYHVDIPRLISAWGSVELKFMESTPSAGTWAIWDIIVSNAAELPRRGEIPVDEGVNLEINDRIVQ